MANRRFQYYPLILGRAGWLTGIGVVLMAVAGWQFAQQTAPAPAAAPETPAPAAVSEDESVASLIQGNLIYTHLGEPDPFYPRPKEEPCKDKKYVLAHPAECDPDKKLTGCKKYKLEEMILSGITNTMGMNIAMLSAEGKPYFVKVGDQCRDAKVLEINNLTTCVKWRQEIPQDQNTIRPYKDVDRCLRPQAGIQTQG